MGDFISQDEVDALLRGCGDDSKKYRDASDFQVFETFEFRGKKLYEITCYTPETESFVIKEMEVGISRSYLIDEEMYLLMKLKFKEST